VYFKKLLIGISLKKLEANPLNDFSGAPFVAGYPGREPGMDDNKRIAAEGSYS
jgi:hypothetical protein